MIEIYHLWSRSRSPAHEADDWLSTIAPTLGLCPGCALFRTDRAIDVPLRGQFDGSALNFFWATGVGIASVKLLDAIGREIVLGKLRLGRVLDSSGNPMSDFRTFQAVERVTIRGGPTSKIRRCDRCKCVIYAPVRSHHLVGNANDFVGLFGTNLGGQLIADESIVKRIDRPRFKNLGILKIPVFSQPLDGNPINLEEASGISRSA